MRNRESQQEKALRDLLKNRRLELGFSQRDLAANRGFPHTYISKYETGERYLTFTEVLLLCRYLNLNAHDVLDKILSVSPEGQGISSSD